MNIRKDGKEYVRCELCQRFATFDHAAQLGWDWFTGTLDRTHHYCREHKTSDQRNIALKNSGVKP